MLSIGTDTVPLVPRPPHAELSTAGLFELLTTTTWIQSVPFRGYAYATTKLHFDESVPRGQIKEK